MNIVQIYKRIKQDLQSIEGELTRSIKTDIPVLNEAANHLLKAGGKRIRPVFVMLSAQFGQYQFEKVKNIAVAMELIHMASLVHDDVIDEADTRRGQPTVKSAWDNRVAMYTGDYIFAQGLVISTELKNPLIHQRLSKALVEMIEGEIEQIRDLYDHNITFRTYLRRIKRKTALLFAISCQLGAMASEAKPEIVQRLYQYGYYVGMAFQITDDVLDIISTPEKLGKPAGNDLTQGNITIPVIYALRHSAHSTQIQQMIINDQVTQNIEQLLDWVKQSGGIEYSLKLAETYLRKGIMALETLPNNESKQGLIDIAKFIGKRNY